MIQSKIVTEIKAITIKIVELGLSIEEHYPVVKGNEIRCNSSVNLSALLKNVSYDDKYSIIDDAKDFNFKMLDGALIQIMYRFDNKGRHLTAHRLAYFPAPHLKAYEDDPDAHDTSYFGNSEFHDIIEKNTLNIPFRFDFDADIKKFKDIHHPYSHMHLGEYEKCRVPVVSPLTPSVFINFILRNFYNTALITKCDNYSFPHKLNFNNSITTNENKLLHINF